MTSDQMWMLVVLFGVGGAFLLLFFIARRFSDRREELLARRLGPDDSINLGGEPILAGGSGRRLSDSGPKLGESVTRQSGAPGHQLGESGARHPVATARATQPGYAAAGSTVLPQPSQIRNWVRCGAPGWQQPMNALMDSSRCTRPWAIRKSSTRYTVGGATRRRRPAASASIRS